MRPDFLRVAPMTPSLSPESPTSPEPCRIEAVFGVGGQIDLLSLQRVAVSLRGLESFSIVAVDLSFAELQKWSG